MNVTLDLETDDYEVSLTFIVDNVDGEDEWSIDYHYIVVSEDGGVGIPRTWEYLNEVYDPAALDRLKQAAQSGKTDVLADIVERLRSHPTRLQTFRPLLNEAAAEIERLRRPTAPSGDGLTEEEIRRIAGKGAAVLANMHNSDPDFKRSWVALRAIEGARQLRGAMPILTAAGYEIRRPSPAHGEGALREALEEYEAQVDAAGGCGDGGCVVKRPKGQRTNGGCRCWGAPMKAQRMMMAGQALASRARSALASSAGEKTK